LAKENKNLKEIEKEHHKLNGDLRKELKQRDEVIDEAIYLLKFGGIDSYVNSVEKTHEFRDKVVNILQKYKGDNNG